ncbi:hypothetical protein, variant 1 [Cryptococcus amylolentus CBS 6039]|nr:hypothetical protein, variant 1 [Cryptococcus amylolentus CBS 6039]ODN79740.1 hypothetical protein, variant 1 [Cryptococcus amylolentus CBS 6039]
MYNAFSCIHLARTDGIRLINMPAASDVRAIETAIERVWVPGIQGKSSVAGTVGTEWKLRGNPWSGIMTEAIQARRLLIHIFHALSAVGWDLHMSVDLTKKQYDKDSVIFRKTTPPREKYFFCVSFNEGDKVRIIDPPNNDVRDAFIQAVRQTWYRGVQTEKEKEHGCYQIKLRGNPWWSSNGLDVNHARIVSLAILSAMDVQGFELAASVDMSVGTEHGGDVDTWFFASK